MTNKNDKPEGVARLRWRAEEIAQAQGGPTPEDLSTLSREEALKLVHELRVHQIELRMQNEELRRAQAELNAIRERYFDLYNLAPVGYFIVSHEGRILETNLAGVILLGDPRAALVKQPITRFIFKEDQDVYYLHRRELLATGKAHTCELRMVKSDGRVFWVRLTAATQAPGAGSRHETGGSPASRVVLSDISEQKQMEEGKAKLDARFRRTKKRPRVGSKAGRSKRGRNATRK
jgi:two-component system cell cycle sensor histidine kinase/response regulator CckA